MPDPTRKKLALTTAAQTAYTVPAEKTARIVSIHVANIDGAASVSVSVRWVDIDDAGIVYLSYLTPLAAGDALTIATDIILKAGDYIQANASANGDAVMTVSIEESPVTVA